MKTEQKRGRGRPRHSTSFASITLEELNKKFGPNDSIVVGRLFLEKGQVTRKLTPQSKDYIAGIGPAADSPDFSSTVEMTLQA